MDLASADAGLHVVGGLTQRSEMSLQQQQQIIHRHDAPTAFKLRAPVLWSAVPNNIL